jgi:hypothetical protein
MNQMGVQYGRLGLIAFITTSTLICLVDQSIGRTPSVNDNHFHCRHPSFGTASAAPICLVLRFGTVTDVDCPLILIRTVVRFDTNSWPAMAAIILVCCSLLIDETVHYRGLAHACHGCIACVAALLSFGK